MKIVENLDLTPYNSYRLHARCARAFFPDTEDEVREAYYSTPERRKILIGSGHNIILAREWYDDDFIVFNGNFNRITVEGTLMEAEAGAFSTTMSEIAQAHGLSGLEFFYDIPSSLGGAIVMNAGAGGEETKDRVVDVRYLDLEDGKIKVIGVRDAQMAYRSSVFQTDANKIVLAATLKLERGDKHEILKRMESMREARFAKQPRNYPTAGSVFKRPEGHFVGPLVDKVGLRGHVCGGAGVSKKHAGMIVNLNAAKGEDIIRLVRIIQSRVRERCEVDLDLEQKIIT